MLNSLSKWFQKTLGIEQHTFEYNEVLYKYADLRLYKKLFSENRKPRIVKELNPIIENVDFSLTYKDLKFVFGEPRLKVTVSTRPSLKIYLYKLTVDEIKIKHFFHFYKGKLVLFSSIFPAVSNEKVLELQNKHFEQYDLPLLTKKNDDVCFKDSKNQYLFLLRNLEYAEHLMIYNQDFKDFVYAELS